MEDTIAPRRVTRIRHELHRRDTVVRRITRPSPNFVAITFADPSLAGFVSSSFDDHVKFIFTDTQGQPVRRDYTPLHHDAAQGELTIEFALHDSGAATRWARQAQVGDRAVIAGPRGSMVIPADYPWHLLAGDTTALPAIVRRLRELPADVSARVLLLAEDAADHRPLHSAARLDVSWVRSPEAFLAAADALQLPEGEGFAWAAGEASLMKRLRQLLVDGKQHPRTAMRVSAYWKQGAQEFHEDLVD
ncbi:MAG: siderophore-interacting protein [Rhodoferax sp.]|nr:siderophore-interacting protein [Rhodoferax sp.]